MRWTLEDKTEGQLAWEDSTCEARSGSPVSNVSVSAGGTVLPNPDYASPGQPRYLWDTAFTYQYDLAGAKPQSVKATGEFNGSSLSGTVTIDGCSQEFQGVFAMIR